jgi:hypothetical protein
MTISNLYLHVDGGYYCLLIDDADYKTTEGDWVPGVVYTGADGRIRSTTRERWEDRFTLMLANDAAIAGMPEDVQSMIRRANPGDPDLDFVRVFESWHQSEINITGNMLELAVAAAIEPFVDLDESDAEDFRLTIRTEDLQRVLQNYEIERVPEPHGFTFVIRKSFPENA